MRGSSSPRSYISRSPTGSISPPSSPADGRISGASRRRRSASPASCRIILRAAGARATRSGLDTPASAVAIFETLRAAGYDVACDLDSPSLIAALAEGPLEATLTLAEYEAELALTPPDFRRSLVAAWGEPAEDRNAIGGAFWFRYVRLGKLIVAVQPDRGDASSRKGDYHDLNLPPRHAYVAFHFWLTRKEKVDAIIQLGAHGTLEWLPGKAVALSESLRARGRARPDAGRLPVHRQQSGRGGAGQAPHRRGDDRPSDAAADRRRIAWRGARARGAVRRIRRGAGARSAPRPRHRGAHPGARARERIARGMRRRRQAARGGARRPRRLALRPQGHARSATACMCSAARRRARKASPPGSISTRRRERDVERAHRRLRRRPNRSGCCAALGGRFVAPGPAGAPARGRLDVLPTGRNLYAIDPRAAPTRNAWEIGRRAAEEVLARYAQDHGDWPKRIVIDLWGSATMRTGGDDLAQAFALIGCRPTWDASSSRVSGFEVLPLAMLGRPRVDVTLRISGPVPRRLSEPDRAVRRRRSRRRRARGERRRQSARRARRREPGAGVRRGAGRIRRWPRSAHRARRLGGAVGPGGGLSSPRPAMPTTARAKGGKRRRRSARVSPAPRPSFTRRTCRGRTRSTPTPSPSMKGASPRRRPRRGRARRSIISTRPRPARPRSAALHRRSRARCADAPPIRAGLPARCATAIAARRKSRSRSTISIASRR